MDKKGTIVESDGVGRAGAEQTYMTHVLSQSAA